jgi:hypothetical protein
MGNDRVRDRLDDLFAPIVRTRIVRDSRFDSQHFVHLWLVALATYGVGDIVTTVTLLWFTDKVNELNAVVLFAVDAYGLAGFIALKLVAFLTAIGVSLLGAHTNDRFLYYLPPVALSLVGGFVTTFNIRLFIG